MVSWEVEVEDFHVVCGVLGVFGLLLGSVSYFVKERLFISEPLVCLLIGAAFSHHGAGFILPNKYADDDRWLSHINLSFARLVLCLQVFLTGLQLPPKYLRQQWRPLLIILGPGMTLMWLISSLIVWALTKNFSFLECLIVGGCIAPTDPVLANSIIKGRFADDYMHLDLTHFIAAESGANDGLAYPFVFLGLWLFYASHSAEISVSTAIGYWFGDTWAYVVLLSVVWGAATGYVARKVLRFFANLRYIDLESFHAFPAFTALTLIGTCGLVGSDDILACFVAGNVMGWTGWFQSETDDDSSQSTLDMLLTQAIFLWFGAVCPWPDFADSADVIGLGRLIALAVLVLLLRRLPVILSLYRFMGPVPNFKFAAIMGHFGPVGVSAIFYLYETVLWLEEHLEPSPEVLRLERVTRLVVWFVVVSCVIVHGLSIPAFKIYEYVAARAGDAEAKGLRERWKKEKDLWQHSTFHIGGPPVDEIQDHSDRPPLPPRRVNWRRLRYPETNSGEW